MAGAFRIYALLIIAPLTVTPLAAADLASPAEPLPPPPPVFFVHVGAQGEFPLTNAQATGGGLFPTTNVAIRPVYTLALEAGYYVTPNIAITLSAGAPPPLARFKATGFPDEPAYGTNLLGSVREGSVRLLVQYHFTQFGAIQPYVGTGVSYFLNFGNISDGILTNFSVDQNFAYILQAGTDIMLTPNWGVFLDLKKAFFSTDAQGFAFPGNIPVRAHIQIDPWVASAGITFKY